MLGPKVDSVLPGVISTFNARRRPRGAPNVRRSLVTRADSRRRSLFIRTRGVRTRVQERKKEREGKRERASVRIKVRNKRERGTTSAARFVGVWRFVPVRVLRNDREHSRRGL